MTDRFRGIGIICCFYFGRLSGIVYRYIDTHNVTRVFRVVANDYCAIINSLLFYLYRKRVVLPIGTYLFDQCVHMDRNNRLLTEH